MKIDIYEKEQFMKSQENSVEVDEDEQFIKQVQETPSILDQKQKDKQIDDNYYQYLSKMKNSVNPSINNQQQNEYSEDM